MPINLNEWADETISDFTGGLVLDSDTELLEKNELSQAMNVVIRNRVLTSDTGYVQYLNPVRGNPRRNYTYKTMDGVSHQVLITDLTVYRKNNEQWQYCSNGTTTQLNGGEPLGETAIAVDSEAGFTAGDHIGIILDTGEMHFTTVASTAAGVLNIDDALPSAAGDNNEVVNSVVLAGENHKHVTGVVLPWNGWLVFTNGIDFVKRYDPSDFSVENLPGLVDTVCETLALYDSSLLIANTTESNVRFPFRVKYSAKGDATAWASLEAGTTDYLETTSDILQLLKLGPYMIAYRSDSILRIGISGGGVRRFDSQTTIPDAGVFSSLAAVGLRDKHLVWGNENFFFYKGGYSIEEIPNTIKDSVFGASGKLKLLQRRSECFSVLLKPVNEVLFVYGISAAEQPPAERYHTDYDKFTRRDFALTLCGFGEHLSVVQPGWDDMTGSWDSQDGSWGSLESLGEGYGIILGDADTEATFLYDFLSVGDGASPLETLIETKDFAHPTYLIQHDFLEIGYQAGDTVTVEYSTDKGNTYTLLGTLPSSGLTNNVRLHSVFTTRKVRFRFTCTSKLSLRYMNMRYMYVSET